MVKITAHSPGSTTENMLDYIKPIARKKRDVLIIHTGTNDVANGVNAISKVRKLGKCIRDIDENEDIEIGFSGIVGRFHRSLATEIKN